jgi:hypothetical protein
VIDLLAAILFIILFIYSLLRGGLFYPVINTLIILYAWYEGWYGTSIWFLVVLLVVQWITVLFKSRGEDVWS